MASGPTTTDPRPRRTFGSATAVLAEHDFRWFLAGYTTSKVGSAMAPVAVAFAVLQTGGGADALGYVIAARILPIVLFLLLGGVLADRLGSRRVMIAADAIRSLAQAAFAALLIFGHPTLWGMALLAMAAGIGEGAFSPSLQALIPKIASRERLTDANALLGVSASTATVAVPRWPGSWRPGPDLEPCSRSTRRATRSASSS